MSNLFQPAVKEKHHARVAIDGPTGSGKTWTAHQWARILAGPDGKVATVDTENRSAAYYAPSPKQLSGDEPTNRMNWWDAPYEFDHLSVRPPYDPRDLAKIIDAGAEHVGTNGVLIIDSLTHYWNGEGGTLDIVDNASSRGNTFTGWKEGTPAQRFMLDKIIHVPCHVIVTMRSKMEYVLDTVERGGKTIQVPRKIGMAPEQRSGIEYEFTLVVDMDLEHRLVVSKSRCSLLADLVMPNGRSAEPAFTFAEWLGSGVERVTLEQAQSLVDRMNAVEPQPARMALKTEFASTFGNPTELLTEQLAEVQAWLAARVGAAGVVPDGTPVQGALADALAASEQDSKDADVEGGES